MAALDRLLQRRVIEEPVENPEIALTPHPVCIMLRRSAAECCMPEATRTVRITATLTKEQERVLRALAAKHHVSVAWLVRYAVGKLVDEAENVQLPLDLFRND